MSPRAPHRIPHSRPSLGAPEAEGAARAVASGFVGTGPLVRHFEQALASLAQRRFALATTSGSAALHLALVGLGVGAGDEVLLPAFACRAVLNAVVAAGAAPVLVDIDPVDFNLAADAAQRRLSARTRLILAPHMFGAPADLNAFLALGTPVLEDAAGALGARYAGLPVGHFGIASIYSFASTKMITAGQGGLLLTDAADLAARVEALLDYDGALPATAKAAAYPTGYNERLTDVPAAIGLAQFKHLPAFLARRRAIAARYDEALAGLPGVGLPAVQGDAEHAYYRYVLKVAGESAAVVGRLQQQGVDARVSGSHWLYDYLDLPAAEFPVCEAIRSHLVSRPIYPGLSDSEVVTVIAAGVRALTAERVR